MRVCIERIAAEGLYERVVKVRTFGQVSVGGQNFDVVYDTGSGILWVPGAGCKQKACASHEQIKANKDITLETDQVDINTALAT